MWLRHSDSILNGLALGLVLVLADEFALALGLVLVLADGFALVVPLYLFWDLAHYLARLLCRRVLRSYSSTSNEQSLFLRHVAFPSQNQS